MDDKQQVIGLLGGSFDPVHNGHITIARSFVQSGYISQLWILLSADPPHKQDTSQLPFDIRLKMLKSVFDSEERIRTSTIEKDLPPPSYTVRTTSYLRKQYPHFQFKLCMGEDSLLNFHTWYQWEQILEDCNLLVARRPSVERLPLNDKIARQTIYISHDPVTVSSTEIRERLKQNKNVAHLLPKEVHDFIQEHNLYNNQ